MNTVLITGGSAGIGLEISKLFAKNGYIICWVSLYEEEVLEAQNELLGEVSETSIHYLVQDLSEETGAQKVYDWVQANNFAIDVLVNNAGFGTFGWSNDIPLDKEVSMIQLNILTLFKLTRIFLRDMVKKDRGTIINISSNSSFQPVPRMSAYAATKAFVSHYSQGVQQELKEMGANVKVITICPAAIKDTKFKSSAKMENIKTFNGLVATTKAEVARDVWKAFQTGNTYQLSGAKLRTLYWLNKILPKRILYFLIRDELSEKT
ncbi:MAG: SDR family NAD(P)-dependent oxidoreductase [Bacteroidota bacterium]